MDPKELEKAKPFDVVVRAQVSAYTVACVLCNALEGGTGYWAQIDNEKGPDYHADKCDEIAAGRGHLMIEDTETGKRYKLDRAALARGVAAMAKDQAKHYADMTSENDDATTGDVLLQCCLLGEVIYG